MAKAKKAAKKAAAPAACTTEVLVVGSKVRAHIRDKEMKMSGELLAALNCVVGCALNAAIERAQANKRATVKPCDL